MLRILILFLFLAFNAGATESSCDQEKERADYWNDKLKERVTEYHRNKHREAKAAYLTCIRNPPQQEPATRSPVVSSSVTPAPVVTPATPPARPPAERTGFTQNSRITVDYNSPKDLAWFQFYQPSDACADNQTDMGLFVKCAAEEKRYKDEFERRWDPINQRLRVSV